MGNQLDGHGEVGLNPVTNDDVNTLNLVVNYIREIESAPDTISYIREIERKTKWRTRRNIRKRILQQWIWPLLA